MCGIVGIFSTVSTGTTASQVKMLRDMITADAVRGYDGTGIFFLKARDGYKKDNPAAREFYYKDAVVGASLLDSLGSWNRMAMDCRFVVGHNRAATMGTVDKENAHPFIFDNVMGVHNGTVLDWEEILKDKYTRSEMDSAAIYEALNGIEPDPQTVGELLGTLELGAYSLVWYDNRIKKLRFARNGDRPMNIVNTATGFLFGSELRMLEWIVDRRDIRMYTAAETKVHTLIDVPVEGGPATYHDYSEDVKYVSVTGSAWDAWNDDPWDYTSYYTGAYRRQQQPRNLHSSRAQATIPRKLLVSTEHDVDRLAVDTVTKENIKSQVRYMTGTSKAKGTGYNQGLREIFDTPEGAWLPHTRAYITGREGKKYLAYIRFEDGVVEPAAFAVPASSMTGDHSAINAVLEEGGAVGIDTTVIGVYAYAPGQTAYALGTPGPDTLAKPAELLSADEWLDMLAIKDEVKAGSHPESVLVSTDIGWHFGWCLQ